MRELVCREDGEKGRQRVSHCGTILSSHSLPIGLSSHTVDLVLPTGTHVHKCSKLVWKVLSFSAVGNWL